MADQELTFDLKPIASPTKLKLKDIVKMANVAEKLKPEELAYYGTQAVHGYLIDLNSRREWEERNQKAMKLALQVTEQKSFPWVGASNVKFPLVTIGALQFLARMSIMTRGRSLVKVGMWGPDPDRSREQRAQREGQYMSYQLIEEQPNWLDDDEIAKLSAAILGCAIKQTEHDGVECINRSEYVPLADFVVDYYCKDLDKANRATRRRTMFTNQVHENVSRGLYLKMEGVAQGSQPENQLNLLQQTADQSQGVRKPTNDTTLGYDILEQHTWLDLDGDGYAEPYVLHVRLDTKQLLRIAPRFFDEGDVYRKFDPVVRKLEAEAKATEDLNERSRLEQEAEKYDTDPKNTVVRIVPLTSFTKYTFIPAPDGGFYGLGLGALLGPTNAAVDTMMNQLIDAGTMQNTAGGFLGRGVKIKGGKQSFDPFEWKVVDSSGDDLRKNIMQLPVSAPSDVLFKLLGLLIEYGERIASATDVMSGVNPGQNTPAETSRNTLEQGMMLFSGIYTRMYRSFGAELRKLYDLNKWYLSGTPQYYELTEGPSPMLMKGDFEDRSSRVSPSADPTAASSSQKVNKAKAVYEVMTQNPNGWNRYEVIKDLLEALECEDIEKVFPDPKGPNAIAPIPNPKVELEKGKLDLKGKELQFAAQEHQDEMQLAIAELQGTLQLNDAKIFELTAKAEKHRAEAEGVETGHDIAIADMQLGMMKERRAETQRLLDSLLNAHHRQQQLKLAKEKQDAPTTKPAATDQ